MKVEDLSKLSPGERYYTTDLKNRLNVEEVLLNTGEVVIAAPWNVPSSVIHVIKEGETYLGRGRPHR